MHNLALSWLPQVLQANGSERFHDYSHSRITRPQQLPTQASRESDRGWGDDRQEWCQWMMMIWSFGDKFPNTLLRHLIPSLHRLQPTTDIMPIYLSMQRVRFSSPDAYEKFKVLFADTRRHLMTLPGFLHLTWWEHPDDRSWYNECSFWTSRGALYDWHKNTYHKYCKTWAANGAIMEDIITNFELVGTRLLRVCPVCNHMQDKKYDLAQEQAVLHEQCPQCGFHFPVLEETPSSFAVFKDVPGLGGDGEVEAKADGKQADETKG